jgi:hypothetical protein
MEGHLDIVNTRILDLFKWEKHEKAFHKSYYCTDFKWQIIESKQKKLRIVFRRLIDIRALK